jgi:cytidylate kinase
MEPLKIGVVGPCASGKSTLIAGLQAHGHWGKHIAQEHSYVANMWSRITHPDLLIYLDVSYPVSQQRRNMDWTEQEFEEQIRRLKDAREKADFYLNTDNLSVEQVLEEVLAFLEQHRSE